MQANAILAGAALAVGAIGMLAMYVRAQARREGEYIDKLAAGLSDVGGSVALYDLYFASGRRSIACALLLAAFLTPTAAYLYRGKPLLAIVSLLTLEGLGAWWIAALVTTPRETAAQNRRLAERAYHAIRKATEGGVLAPVALLLGPERLAVSRADWP